MLEKDVEERRKSRASLLANSSHLDRPQELKEQLAQITVDLKQEKEENGKEQV